MSVNQFPDRGIEGKRRAAENGAAALLWSRFGIELAQQSGKLLLLRAVERGKDFRHTFLEQRQGRLVELGAFVREHDVHHAAVMLVAFAQHQFLFFQPIDDPGQVAHRNHHLGTDLAEWQATSVADGGEHVKLRRREPGLLQVVVQFFVGLQAEAQKSNP